MVPQTVPGPDGTTFVLVAGHFSVPKHGTAVVDENRETIFRKVGEPLGSPCCRTLCMVLMVQHLASRGAFFGPKTLFGSGGRKSRDDLAEA